jgi:hypothetical protein
MKTKYIALLISFLALTSAQAQILKGTVVESGNTQKMYNVFVQDINNKSVALTDKKGNFDIKTAEGHTLIFTSPGYISDTLYVTDMRPKHVTMVVQGISLREVNVSATRRAFNPRVEYADVYRKSKVYPMSPTTWFSKEGRDARRLKHYFEREEQERHIDSVFSRVYVSSMIPLRGQQLEDFMTLYRPTYAYVMNNNGPSLAVYINDSYKKYRALPADKRTVQKLMP